MLDEGLRALARSGPQLAPGHVEKALRLAFRRRKRNRRMVWAGAAGIAAALVIWIFMPQVPEVGPPEPVLARIEVPDVRLPGPQAVRLRQRPARVSAPRMDHFYRLPGADNPFEYGAVVRVEVPRPALQLVGFPVNPDRFPETVKADLLLGQDGIARAVRFVP